ncbi:hypothetical protein [[Pseudomonas] boreopolis]|uniref:hypothetical protein n=1 Tax=Xanthomonas boreopolis TaxID=86183 RepID=UPI003D9B0F4E
MIDLLETALHAHGGLARWQATKKLGAHIMVGGAMWHVKGWPGALSDVHVSVDPHHQHAEYAPFLDHGQRGIFEPDKTTIVSGNGVVVERESPRSAFGGHTLMTPWDTQHLLYFAGCAMWTYLTTPFLFSLPGFKTEEIEPWSEGGETWRRLRVGFPATIHSHSSEQVFYFDSFDGLLRRHDYSVEIMGGTSSANYASDYRTVNGLAFPARRRVYAKGADNRPILDRAAVAIDFLEIQVD